MALFNKPAPPLHSASMGGMQPLAGHPGMGGMHASASAPVMHAAPQQQHQQQRAHMAPHALPASQLAQPQQYNLGGQQLFRGLGSGLPGQQAVAAQVPMAAAPAQQHDSNWAQWH